MGSSLVLKNDIESEFKVIHPDGAGARTISSKDLMGTMLVNSIAELKLISGINADKLEVLGYYTKGDGGGGLFYWDSASTETDNGGTIIQATGVTTGRWKRVFSGTVNVKWFGAKGDYNPITNIGTDDYLSIQKALNFTSDVYAPEGYYLISDCIKVGNKNLSGAGVDKTFFVSSFSGVQWAAVSAGKEGWTSVSDILFGGSLSKFTILRRTGTNYVIGLLVTGSRNVNISDVKTQNHQIGYFIENTSEMTMTQVSDISSNWGFVFDNRGTRTSSNRPGGYSGNSDNDISSCNLLGLTSYYAQHTAVLSMNCGTINVQGMTVGRFCDSPSAITPYGFPTTHFGIHIYGTSTKWVRNSLINNVVFEVEGTGLSQTCIKIENTSTANPVSNFTIENCEVQTYDKDLDAGIYTTFLDVNAPYNIINVSIMNSGFTFNVTGFYSGQLIKMAGLTTIKAYNVYPLNSLSNSILHQGFSLQDDRTIKLADNMSTATAGLGNLPTGWTAIGAISTYLTAVTATNSAPSMIKLAGGSASPMGMYYRMYYRQEKWQYLMPYVKIIFAGDYIEPTLKVNNQSDTLTSSKTDTNKSRYGNVLRQTTNSNNVKNIFWTFPKFDAGYPFDYIDLTLQQNTTTTSVLTSIYYVEIGFIEKYEDLQVFS